MTIVAIILSLIAICGVVIVFSQTAKVKNEIIHMNSLLLRHLNADAEQRTKTEKRLNDLESGTVPDFEKAKSAVNAVNDFNAGIAGILGYDPYEALKKAREENGGAAE